MNTVRPAALGSWGTQRGCSGQPAQAARAKKNCKPAAGCRRRRAAVCPCGHVSDCPSADSVNCSGGTSGERVGFHYEPREDTGLFWSNDPATTIGVMVRSIGGEEIDAQVERNRRLQDAARSPGP